MGKVCAASFCRKTITGTEINFYPFPDKRDPLRLIWSKRLLASDSRLHQYACYRHFSDQQFYYNHITKRMEIQRSALPDKNIVRRTNDPKDPLDAVCRFCLERSESDYQMIFPVWPNPDVPTADEIAELFGVVITPDDSLPRIVCITCLTKIKYLKRIRNQFQKNDAILRAKFAAPPTIIPSPQQKQVVPVVEPNYSSLSDAYPKITAVASLGKNPVDIPLAASGSDDVLQEAHSSVVYVQEGNTYQQFRIINSGQIMSLGNEQGEVEGKSVKLEDMDVVESDLVEIIDSEDGEGEQESDQVKIEYQELDVGSLPKEEDSQPDKLEKPPPKKKLRVYTAFQSGAQIKLEGDET